MFNQAQMSQVQIPNKFTFLVQEVDNLKKEVKDIKSNIEPLKEIPNKLDNLINIISNQNSFANLNNSQNNILSSSQISQSSQSSLIMNDKIKINFNNINNSQFADQNGSLNNKLNPFINNKPVNKIPQVFNANNLNKDKKRKKKYKPRDPFYYYYINEGKVYKYTCENKDRKNNLKFNCSDTKCKAFGYYYNDIKEFKPNEDIQHIEYEAHSYIIPKISREKYFEMMDMLKMILKS